MALELDPERLNHHRDQDPATGATIIPARLGWWAQMRRERMCYRLHGHCFHTSLYTFWRCCICAAVVEWYPTQDCRYCPTSIEEKK